MTHLQALGTSLLYRVVVNKELSLCFQTAGECFSSYQHLLLSGQRGMKLEILSDTGWIDINDPTICSWCRKPFGREPHTECQIEEDKAYADFVDYRQSALMDLHW